MHKKISIVEVCDWNGKHDNSSIWMVYQVYKQVGESYVSTTN